VAVGVVAERDRVGSGLEQVARGALGDPHPARGVLTVHDHEVGCVAVAQPRQQRRQRAPPTAPDHIADE
jgi:hypothetical protein